MQRALMEELIAWKDRKKRKPLILRGARQVGKTWILKEFGTSEFSDLAYIPMDDNRAMSDLFGGSLDPQRLLEGISQYVGRAVTRDTLIVFDEVQAVPRALTALKYFNEEAPEYAVAVAGSLLGMALHSGISYPVGKVDFLDLHPMSFEEFLTADGEENLAEMIQMSNFDMLGVFAERMTDLLKRYYYVGGMPEAVQEYITTGDMSRVRAIQQAILSAYENDFSKHTTKEYAVRCRQIWQSIPSQLAKENKRFIFGAAREGSRGRDYAGALQFMVDCGLIHLVPRVSKAAIPLEAYKKQIGFKLFLADIGLLGAMTDLETRTLAEGDRLFQEFKGAYAEQFVCQELNAIEGMKLYYWSADNNPGEVDFLFHAGGTVYPIEVKAAENLKSKSLAAFCKRYDLHTGIRLSLSGYRDEGWMRNIPLYATGSLATIKRG